MKLEHEASSPIPIEIRTEQNKVVKLMGQVRKQPGHSLFEYNVKTDNLSVVELKINSVDITSKDLHLRMVTNPDCLYVTALNRKNAIKKIRIISEKIS